jgi:CHASE3 domain sensor protein
MLPRIRFRGKVMYMLIGMMTALLLANIFLTIKTNRQIAEDKALHEEADGIRIQLIEVLRTLHLIDVGLRGFALYDDQQMLAPFDSANKRQERYFRQLENSLKAQNFPMQEFYWFKDTVDQYYELTNKMKAHLENKERAAFDSLFRSDAGFPLQKSYRGFLRKVNEFEEKISAGAKQRYTRGLEFNSWVQIFLFVLGVPTLLYIGFYASQTFRMAEDLHKSEQDKVEILAGQNHLLEYKVQERTNELVSLNEEITAQNEEIQSSNDQLLLQRDTLAKQHELLITSIRNYRRLTS